jgi:hypothetical protein
MICLSLNEVCLALLLTDPAVVVFSMKTVNRQEAGCVNYVSRMDSKHTSEFGRASEGRIVESNFWM